MINAVVPGLPVTKLQSVLLPGFKVKRGNGATHAHQNAPFGFNCLSRLVGFRTYDLNNLENNKTKIFLLPGNTGRKRYSRRHFVVGVLTQSSGQDDCLGMVLRVFGDSSMFISALKDEVNCYNPINTEKSLTNTV